LRCPGLVVRSEGRARYVNGRYFIHRAFLTRDVQAGCGSVHQLPNGQGLGKFYSFPAAQTALRAGSVAGECLEFARRVSCALFCLEASSARCEGARCVAASSSISERWPLLSTRTNQAKPLHRLTPCRRLRRGPCPQTLTSSDLIDTSR
jgi:hypothetical protein